jgi:hypothetical protein
MGIGLGELEIFLVGKGFDGTSINDFLTFLGPMLDGEFGGERFPRTRVCSYQDMLVLENSLDGIFLEITQGIGVVGKFGEVLLFGPNFGTYFDHFILLLFWGVGGVDFGGGISILFLGGGGCGIY